MGSRLQILGPVALRSAADREAAHLGRKAQALLAFVASRGLNGTTRSNLLALLWADHGEEEARNSLRQCLHQIRHAFGDAGELFELSGDRVGLRESRCQVDLWDFERLVARGDPDSLVAAAMLYQGEFADGLNAGADIERWLAAERERLRAVAYDLAERLCAVASTHSERDAAMSLARQLLLDDPVHEGGYRIMMRLYAEAGLRAKALQLWDECRRVLRIELGVEPSPETTALHQQLLAPSAVAGNASSSSPPQLLPAIAAAAVTPGRDPFGYDRQVLDHLLRGWQLFTEFTKHANPRARAQFAAAIEKAPDHAEALAMLGWTDFMDFISGWTQDPERSLAQAADLADRSVACNRGSHSPHALKGKVLLWQMAHDEALVELRRAITVTPGAAYAHFNLGEATMWGGLYDEALLHVRRALRFDPNDRGVFVTVEGITLFCKGELAAARQALESAIVRNPTYAWPHATLAALSVEEGNLAAARESAATARRINRRFSVDFAANVMPIQNADLRARFVAGWRAAGMPEQEGQWTEPEEQRVT